MKTRHLLKRESGLRCVHFVIGLLVLTSLCSCARSRAQSQNAPEACRALAQSMANQERNFVARAQTIREQHILLRDYDLQMIAVLNERRKSLVSTVLTDASADEGVAGCSGQELENLRLQALQETVLLQRYLDNFKRELQEDPPGVFIDPR